MFLQQVTALVHSQRRVVQVDAAGAASAKEAERAVEIPSLVVFECGLSDPAATWRVARIEEIGARSS